MTMPDTKAATSISVDLHYRLEQLRGQYDAARFQPFVELGPDTGGAESTPYFPGFRKTRLFEQENILQRDDVLLHADHFGDVGDAAGAVAEARSLDKQVDGRGDLLADGTNTHIGIGHADHHLETAQTVARGVGVERGERSVVTGVHGLQHIQGLFRSDFPDDDAVGAHTEGIDN